MTTHFDALLATLFASPEAVGIIGTGKQAREMRAVMADKLRLRIDDLPGYSSADAPLDRLFHLLCATPESAASATLIARGVDADTLVSWAGLEAFIRAAPEEIFHRHLGLRLPKETDDVRFPTGIQQLFQCTLRQFEEVLKAIGHPDPSWPTTELQRLDRFSTIYLQLRREGQELDPTQERRLLFPSTGRCGGISLTKALSEHPRMTLRVNHEGLCGPIYQMLRLHHQGRLGADVLAVVLIQMLDDFDCLGGNPFCFLLPFLPQVPGFECHLLRVERDLPGLRESILQRNFHYTPADFVPERITGADWGDMSEAAWNALTVPQKVDWYITRVHGEIDRGTAACASVVRTPLDNLQEGLNSLLARMRWPQLASIPHVNTIPKDRIYTLEERIALFQEEHAKL